MDDREPFRGFKEGHGQLSKSSAEIRLEGRQVSSGKAAEWLGVRKRVLQVFKRSHEPRR